MRGVGLHHSGFVQVGIAPSAILGHL